MRIKVNRESIRAHKKAIIIDVELLNQQHIKKLITNQDFFKGVVKLECLQNYLYKLEGGLV
jgi:hypothetical protein